MMLFLPTELRDATLMATLVGRTVTAARYLDVADGWGEQERAFLTFDDGRTIEFSGWGHDAWGVNATDVTSDEDHPCDPS